MLGGSRESVVGVDKQEYAGGVLLPCEGGNLKWNGTAKRKDPGADVLQTLPSL